MIEPMTIADWLAFDREHPAPTFFARPAWALALADSQPAMRPAPLRVTLPGGATIVLPLMQMAGGALRWREYCGFPLGAYTCFMRDDGSLASAAQCNAVLDELVRFADNATIVPWPLGPVPDRYATEQHETAVVDLAGGIEAALSGVAGIFRRMAGQAERRGVTCAPSRDADAVDEYYRLLRASAVRWGIGEPNIRKAMIEALVERGGDDVEIWFARAEGVNIGGGIVFYGSREFFFWSAAMDADYGKLRPSNALNFALLRAAADRGMEFYNLGSSEGLPGVAKFKENLGARDVQYGWYKTSRPAFKLYTGVRRVLATRAAS